MNTVSSHLPANRLSFKANLTPRDLKFKQALLEGLLENYQFTAKIEDLDSILGPDELKLLLKKFCTRDYLVGLYLPHTRPPEERFIGVKNGTYRVNLHCHTRHSDGKMSTEEFLDQSRRYADRVAKLNKNDDLPPYTAAITDHNNLDGPQDAIAMIANEPKKYKNLKFAPGCEYMFYDTKSNLQSPMFEAVALGINPYDKKLNKQLTFLNPIKLIKKIKEDGGVVSYAHPLRFCQKNEFNPKFIEYLKSIGINGVETNYQYIKILNNPKLGKQINLVKDITNINGWFATGGTDSHATNIFHETAEPILDKLI